MALAEKSRPAEAGELDDVTVARARRGDPGAARALVRCYERRVFAVLTRIVGRKAGAARIEELAQETFLRAFGKLPSWQFGGPRLSAFILTVATRLALDELRTARRWPTVELPELEAADRADEAAERAALGRALARALATLPAEQRAAVVLRELHDFSYAEVAEALGCDLGTVKSRIARARAALRAALAEEAT
jgi:RNA polymerase sigma-70 factor (ECF subfamily)